MIKIGIVGNIGSGKSFISKKFGYPVFDADKEVRNIYNSDIACFKKLNKLFPKHILSFPIKKKKLINLILSNENNLKKINKVIHPIVRKKLNYFFKKNKKKNFVVLDIPLLLENKLNKKGYIIIFIDAKKKNILFNLKKRKNYNFKILKKLEKLQLPSEIKKKKSNYIIKNNFKEIDIKKNVKLIKEKLKK